MTRALVLAAGKSTRIAALAQGQPKPLLEIGGAPVLVHNLELLARHGVRDIWINVHHEADAIRRAIGDGSRWGVSVSYSFEPELLGTAGAVKKLAGELGSATFLVLYGDNFTNCNIDGLLDGHRTSESVATIVVFDSRRSWNSGIAGGTVEVNERSEVERFVEGGAEPRSTLVNAGIYALEPEVIDHIPEGFSDFGKQIFPALLAQKLRVGAYVMEGYCLALDTPDSYAQAQKIQAALELEAKR